MTIERHGSAEPVPSRSSRGSWPTCYGYLRGRDPSLEEIRAVRDQMVRFCEVNRLYLARIFHDLDVEPTQLDYPSLRDFMNRAAQPGTHTVLLVDLEFLREPSRVLATIAAALAEDLPHLRVQCFLDAAAFQLLAEQS